MLGAKATSTEVSEAMSATLVPESPPKLQMIGSFIGVDIEKHTKFETSWKPSCYARKLRTETNPQSMYAWQDKGKRQGQPGGAIARCAAMRCTGYAPQARYHTVEWCPEPPWKRESRASIPWIVRGLRCRELSSLSASMWSQTTAPRGALSSTPRQKDSCISSGYEDLPPFEFCTLLGISAPPFYPTEHSNYPHHHPKVIACNSSVLTFSGCPQNNTMEHCVLSRLPGSRKKQATIHVSNRKGDRTAWQVAE